MERIGRDKTKDTVVISYLDYPVYSSKVREVIVALRPKPSLTLSPPSK